MSGVDTGRLVAAVVGLLAVVACSASGADRPAATIALETPTTIVIVRHAEKETTPDDPDPALSVAGVERSDLLARMLAGAPVAATYASEYERTQATLRPLAAAHGLDVTVHPAADSSGLAEAIRSRHSGHLVVVAGHSNTVPAIIAALGAESIDEIDESVYDDFLVVTLAGGARPSLLILKYGAPPNSMP